MSKTCTKGRDQIKPRVRDVQMLPISSASSPGELVRCQRLLQIFGAPTPASLLIDKSELSGIKPPPRTTSNANVLSRLASVPPFIVVFFNRGQ